MCFTNGFLNYFLTDSSMRAKMLRIFIFYLEYFPSYKTSFVIIMKKIFFLKFSLLLQNVQHIVNSKKVFKIFDIEYLQNFIFQKIK